MDKAHNDLTLSRTELLLYLCTMAYFPEFSHRSYDTVGGFVAEYLRTPSKLRPYTMFAGFCPDDRSGVTDLMKRAARCERLMRLPVVYSSAGSGQFSSLCVKEDVTRGGMVVRRDVYIIIGCNYRFGEYDSDYGRTSTWEDNFLGAVQNGTAEQKGILRFYDEAVHAALADLPAGAGYTITVSGHSKAGCLAQYITLMRENVTRCAAFDGEGFSPLFMRENADIAAARGSKIINICPDMSVTGCLLIPAPGARQVFLRTGFLRERGAHILPPYYHIPMSVLNGSGKLRPRAKRCEPLSVMLHRLSLVSVGAARLLPFVDEEKALRGLGRAVMHYFKGRKLRAMRTLMDCNTLILLAAGAATAAALLPVTLAEALIQNDKRR